MESLSDTQWDVVISGTGLQQSLLALALSRSGKKILHVDASGTYGGAEAALTLPEADAWADAHRDDSDSDGGGIFSGARASRSDGDGDAPASWRGYSVALAPQVVHTRSALLAQLVSSKAFRQMDFLAVGSVFVYQAPAEAEAAPGGGGHGSLARVPSTREDVFSSTALSTRSKRALTKFLKFVVDYAAPPQADVWTPRAAEPLADFLAAEFRLDEDLRASIVALTLSLDARVPVGKGLAAVHRHLASMGSLGAGFAAVYPKWGGLSEIAQAGCRAGAVGGAVYMLGVGVDDVRPAADPARLRVALADGTVVHARRVVQATPAEDALRVSRLVAVVRSPLPHLFEPAVDGAPTPCVAVVAFPVGCALGPAPCDGPVYAAVHSSDAGECPPGQYEPADSSGIVYLSTLSSSTSQAVLATALAALLSAAPAPAPEILYQLSYEQAGARDAAAGGAAHDGVWSFAPLPLDLAFDDGALAPVRAAWEWITQDEVHTRGEFMDFKDREGVDEDEYEN